MVYAPAGVEIDGYLEVEFCHDVVFACCYSLGEEGGVEVVDVGLVVLSVMEVHDLSANVRFESLGWEGQQIRT